MGNAIIYKSPKYGRQAEPWKLNNNQKRMCGRAFLEREAFAKSKNNFLTTNRKSQSAFSIKLYWRVWSWLRTNAGGVPNTCKSSEEIPFGDEPSGGRVSNTWATCLIEGNSLPKGRLIPHNITFSHEEVIKGVIRYKMGPRRIS